MENRHTACLFTNTHITPRVVYAVGNVAVLQIILHLSDSHHRTVILGFLCRRAKMRDHNTSILPCCRGIWKIGHILSHPASPDALQNRLLIHKKISCKIQENHAVLHLRKGFFTDHALRRIHERHVNGNDITLLINLFHLEHMLYVAAQIPGSVHGHIGIVAVNFHTQMFCHVCHLHTDGAQTDNTQFLALNFGSGKILFRLFRIFGYVLIGHVLLHPLDAAGHVTGS